MLDATDNTLAGAQLAERVLERLQLTNIRRTRSGALDRNLRANMSLIFRKDKARPLTLRTAVAVGHALDIPIRQLLSDPTDDLDAEMTTLLAKRLSQKSDEREIDGVVAERRVVAAIEAHRVKQGLGWPSIALLSGVDRWWLDRLPKRTRCGLQLSRLSTVLRALKIDLIATIEDTSLDLAARDDEGDEVDDV